MTDPLFVDVYHYDVGGKPDWKALVAAGPPWHGAIVKVSEGVGGSSRGQTDLAAWFPLQWPVIREASGARYGVDFFRGGYHYLLAGVDGAAQAAHYLKRIEDAGGWGDGDLWPIVDVEEGGNRTRSREEIIDSAAEFVEHVRARTGRAVMLYGGWWLAHMKIGDRLGCSWLWYPSYTAALPVASYQRIGWTRDQLLAWQYCGDGDGELQGYPMRSPLGATDISAVTVAGGGAKALEWLRANLRTKEAEQPRMLYVTSPMMRGPDVLEVQQKLEKLGYATGMIDGAYGPTTAGAVRAFQRDHALEVDGVIGPDTRAVLSTATKPARPEPSPLGLRALVEAERHIGIKEDPPGSNRTRFGQWFGVNGVPWCNIFVSYCFSEGAGYTIVDNFAGGPAVGIFKGKGCAYVPTTEAWLRATGMWLGRVPPLPGDIAIYNWNGGRPDHIGLVVKDLGGGRFEAIEGNTSVGNFSDGGEVRRCTRYLEQVNGFGRVT